jgi:hypothetical protein
MQVADDDASVAWELLASFRERCSALRAWSSATFVASSSWEASARAGCRGAATVSHDDQRRRPRSRLDRLAIGVLLIPFAEE